MDERNRKVEDYLEDLAEIKKMIHQSEDFGLIEIWVYFVYGVLVSGGSLISYYLTTARDATRASIFLVVWVPVIVLAGLSETIGWLRKMDKSSTPLLNSKFVKFGSAFFGQMIIFSIMGYFLINSPVPHPGIYMLIGAVPMFLYSTMTYSSIVLEGWVLTGGGIILLLNGVSSVQWSLFAGLFIGMVYLALGVHVRYEEKRSNG